MTKKMAERGRLVQIPPSNEAPSEPAPMNQSNRAPYTGVGAMMGMLGKSSPLGQELESVKAKLASYDGSIPLKILDPKKVVPGKYSNRHPSEYESAEFNALRLEIQSAKINVQPIKVRPLAGSEDQYEIVFGHRRRMACLMEGTGVLAMIESVDDKSLWLEMDRENRGRKDLTPWEQGKSIKRALQEGLFPSIRKLAEESGIDASNASKYLKIAELPNTIIEAFPSPSDIQARWGVQLAEAMMKDPEGVVNRATELSKQPKDKRSALSVLKHLLGEEVIKSQQVTVIKGNDGRTIATVKVVAQGKYRLDIDFDIGLEKCEALVRQLCAS